MLSNKQREFYFENGYLIVEGLLSDEKLGRARMALEERYVLEGDQAGSESVYSPGVRRLANLFSKGRIWEEIAVEPIAIEVARLTIGNEVRWQAMIRCRVSQQLIRQFMQIDLSSRIARGI